MVNCRVKKQDLLLFLILIGLGVVYYMGFIARIGGGTYHLLPPPSSTEAYARDDRTAVSSHITDAAIATTTGGTTIDRALVDTLLQDLSSLLAEKKSRKSALEMIRRWRSRYNFDAAGGSVNISSSRSGSGDGSATDCSQCPCQTTGTGAEPGTGAIASSSTSTSTSTSSSEPHPYDDSAEYERIQKMMDELSRVKHEYEDPTEVRDLLQRTRHLQTQPYQLRLSVCMPINKRYNLVRAIAERLKRQKYVNIQLVFHDDSSLPPSMPLDYIDTYVWHRSDGGYHRTRALRETSWLATNDYFVFLDDDCFPTSDYWALAMVEKLREGWDIVRGPFKVLRLNDDYTVNQGALDHLTRGQKTLGRIPSWFSTTNVGFNRRRFMEIDIDMAFDGHYGNEDVDLGRTTASITPPLNRTTLSGGTGFVWHVGKKYASRKGTQKTFAMDMAYTKQLLRGKWKCKKTCEIVEGYLPRQWDSLRQQSVCPTGRQPVPGSQWNCE